MKKNNHESIVAVPVPAPVAVTHIPFKSSATKRTGVLREVLSNPYRLCTAEEIALCIGRNEKFVRVARSAGAPFPGGVSRPEWILGWLQATPSFAVKQSTGVK